MINSNSGYSTRLMTKNYELDFFMNSFKTTNNKLLNIIPNFNNSMPIFFDAVLTSNQIVSIN
jgi:hypothetical protein